MNFEFFKKPDSKPKESKPEQDAVRENVLEKTGLEAVDQSSAEPIETNLEPKKMDDAEAVSGKSKTNESSEQVIEITAEEIEKRKKMAISEAEREVAILLSAQDGTKEQTIEGRPKRDKKEIYKLVAKAMAVVLLASTVSACMGINCRQVVIGQMELKDNQGNSVPVAVTKEICNEVISGPVVRPYLNNPYYYGNPYGAVGVVSGPGIPGGVVYYNGGNHPRPNVFYQGVIKKDRRK